MFDMRGIGRKISELRKEKNLTQVELADQLGISYQAVSHWERGESMPDISKLSDISQIFDVSIDDLLGNKKQSDVVKKVIDNQKINADSLDDETLEFVLPIMKPDKVKETFKDVSKLSLHQILTLLPFLETEQIDQLVLDFYESDANVRLETFAPFMSDHGLEKLTNDLMSKKGKFDANQIIGLAPFLDEAYLDELVLKQFEKGSSFKFTALAPFLSSTGLSKIVLKHLANDQIFESSQVSALAPFLEEDVLDLIALQQYERVDTQSIMGLAPFISSKIVSQIIKDLLSKGSMHEVTMLAPFSDFDLSELIKSAFKNDAKK